MKARHRSALCCAVLLTLALLPAGSAWAQRIVIDPGHGGSDPGGTGTGMQEKEVVLDISLRFHDLLEADTADKTGGGSWTVSMTRDTDVFVSLAARSSYANSVEADRFMSIHANAFGNTSANGTETFSYSSSGTSAKLRDLVQEEMISAWGLTNRGNKTAGFSVLVNTAMPAELHELGFITNATDAAKLGSNTAREDAARAHLRALQRHYDLVPFLPGEENDPSLGSLRVDVISVDGSPIANALASVDGDVQGETDESGELVIADLALGEHFIEVRASGFQAADATIDIQADELSVQLFELLPTSEIDDPQEDPRGGSENCDSAQAECRRPDNGLVGGCSTSGDGGGLGFALLALVMTLRRRTRQAPCRLR